MRKALLSVLKARSITGAMIRSALLLGFSTFVSMIMTRAYAGSLPWTLRVLFPLLYAGALGVFGRFATNILQGMDEQRSGPSARAIVARTRGSTLLLLPLAAIPVLFAWRYAGWLEQDGVPLATSWLEGDPLVASIALVAVTTFVIPLAEEYYYRWVLHREFVTVFGNVVLVMFANATWFMLGHSVQAMPVAFVLGLVNTALVVISGSWRVPFLVHLATNAVLDLVAL